MVHFNLFSQFCMSDFGVCSSLKQSYTKLSISNWTQVAGILFGYCIDCLKLDETMSMFQGAFAACKIRERDMLLSKMQSKEQSHQTEYPDSKLTELSPLKYNSKLMNSIWGLYNRYSVHNFKQNTDANNASQYIVGEQQSKETVLSNSGMESSKNATVLNKAFDNILFKFTNSQHV